MATSTRLTVATTSQPPTDNGETETETSTGGGLNVGLSVGLGVVVAVALVALTACARIYWKKRRARNQATFQEDDSARSYAPESARQLGVVEMPPSDSSCELQGHPKRHEAHELDV